MSANCGVCDLKVDAEKSFIKCNGVCDKTFHNDCVKGVSVTTRAGKKWKCEECSVKLSTCSTKSSSSDTTAVTKGFMIDVLEAFKSEVFSELKSHTTQMEEFKSSIQFLSNAVDTSNVLMLEIRNEYAEMRKENEELRIKNHHLMESVTDLKIRVRELEQYSRKTNIEISGLPVTNKEDITSLLKDVGTAIGEDLQEGQVMAVHRVPSYNRKQTPSVVVQFLTRLQRDSWIASFKKKKNLTASEVNKTFPNSKVYINEHLSPENKQFLSKLKQQCKEMGVKFVWFRDGKFYVRKCEGEKCHKINKLDDLKSLCK